MRKEKRKEKEKKDSGVGEVESQKETTSELSIVLSAGRRAGWITEKGKVRRKLRLKGRVEVKTPWGSDAFSVRGESTFIFSSDQSIEGIHFDLSFMTPEEAGARALRCALSDIVASGGIPSFVFLNVSGSSPKIVGRIGNGAVDEAEKLGIKVVGGDISKGDGGASISVFAVGMCDDEKPLSRFGAKPGDHIFMTGTAGDSALALKVLREKGRKYAEKMVPQSLEKFLRPPLRFRDMKKIKRIAHFSADVSDGALKTVEWFCILNNVSAEFFPERIPFSEEFLRFAPEFFENPKEILATWGDDYEISFGVKEDSWKKGRRYGEVIGIVLSSRDVKRALEMGYPYKKIRGIDGRELFIFFTYNIKIAGSGYSHF